MSLKVQLPIIEAWERHAILWDECLKCGIATRATQKVFARGALPCDILFIGEGPGKTEDAVGEPFVGKAGRLLDSWINRAWGSYYEYFAERYDEVKHSDDEKGIADFLQKMNDGCPSFCISNVVLCRPCNEAGGPNRPPTDVEISNCAPRLSQLLQIAQPSAIILLGRVAAENVPKFTGPKLALRHPAFILRTDGGGMGGKNDLEQVRLLTEFLKKEFAL